MSYNVINVQFKMVYFNSHYDSKLLTRVNQNNLLRIIKKGCKMKTMGAIFHISHTVTYIIDEIAKQLQSNFLLKSFHMLDDRCKVFFRKNLKTVTSRELGLQTSINTGMRCLKPPETNTKTQNCENGVRLKLQQNLRISQFRDFHFYRGVHNINNYVVLLTVDKRISPPTRCSNIIFYFGNHSVTQHFNSNERLSKSKDNIMYKK